MILPIVTIGSQDVQMAFPRKEIEGPFAWAENDATFYIEGGGDDSTLVAANATTNGLASSPYSDEQFLFKTTSIKVSGSTSFNLVGGGLAIDPDQDFTIELWLYMPTPDGAYDANFFGRYAGNNDRFHMAINSAQNFHVWNNTANPVVVVEAVNLHNVWQHVSINYNSTTHLWEIYVGGVLQGSATWDIDPNVSLMTEGMRVYNPGDPNSYYIDRYQIVPRVLRTTNFDPNTIY